MAPEEASAPARGEGTILVVEDDAAVRELTREILGSPVRGTGSAGGRSGFRDDRAARRGRSISDHRSGDAGNERRRVRRLLAARYPEIRVLYTSGLRGAARCGTAEAPDIASSIRKPFKSDDLVRKVCELVKKTTSRTPGRRKTSTPLIIRTLSPDGFESEKERRTLLRPCLRPDPAAVP